MRGRRRRRRDGGKKLHSQLQNRNKVGVTGECMGPLAMHMHMDIQTPMTTQPIGQNNHIAHYTLPKAKTSFTRCAFNRKWCLYICLRTA